MERQRFEDSWKEAFKDTEMSPSENLWTNIELDLEKAEGKKMKKRILYFKLMAAASVAFAMTFAGVGVLYMNNQQDKLVANNKSGETTSSQKDRDVTENNASANNEAASKETDPKTQLPDGSSVAESTTAIDPSTQNISEEKSIAQAKTDAADQAKGVNRSTKATVAGNNDLQLATNNSKTNSNNGIHDPKLETRNGQDQIAHNSTKTSGTQQNNSAEPTKADRIFDISTNAVAGNRNESHVTPAVAASQATEEERMIANAKLPEIVHIRKPAYQSQQNNVDPVKAMLERLAEEEKKYASNKGSKEDKQSKKGKERLWTSLGVAAGSFSTLVSGPQGASPAVNEQFSQTSTAYLDSHSAGRSSLSDNIVREQSRASGTSYAVAVSLGGKISQRWVLQGGLSYMTQSSEYMTNGLVSSAGFKDLKLGSISELNNASKSDKLLTVAQYNVHSSSRFLNVPLQAGYLVVDRDFGLQFNAGFSTDVFLQNTLTPDGGIIQQVSNDGEVSYSHVEETTQSAGDESPYRTLNFSGLLSTELSYRFGQHYRIAINPGIRYPFSSIYKSEIAVDAMPLTFDVGLRFRYIFN